jgi:Na+/proline symporter
MNALDYAVLLGTMFAIVAYGVWRTRGKQNLEHYLHGDKTTRWGTIGLSVMATQASAITFLSTPGQAYDSGMAFVQNYFGLPLALIIVAAVFLPLYRRLKVNTAYEFLGRRFDNKTRLLGAVFFLLHRGLAAGITIYAPAIIVSTVLGWSLDLMILATGIVVIIYTVSGGTQAVSLTQKHQMAVIFAGMAAAFIVVILKLPPNLSFSDALHVAGSMGKLEAVDFSLDPGKRYTIWTGICGGLFLSLSYFGTDQSQVQRYLAGGSLRESRLGLMFNAVFKIPMQFFILLLGALVFVFYQFEPPPVFFNKSLWEREAAGASGAPLRALEERHASTHAAKEAALQQWLDVRAREGEDSAATVAARAEVLEAQQRSDVLRREAKDALLAVNARAKVKDSDYVFIRFVLDYLPHGLIGLFLAVVFAAALSSTASELNALGSTTCVDIYQAFLRRDAADTHYVSASRWFTTLWGGLALGFAFYLKLAENLIEGVNIVGSLFYGVLLGLFVVAFFLRWIGATALFWGAILAQAAVALIFVVGRAWPEYEIGYLWLNPIGVGLCVLFSVLLHMVLGPRDQTVELPAE